MAAVRVNVCEVKRTVSRWTYRETDTVLFRGGFCAIVAAATPEIDRLERFLCVLDGRCLCRLGSGRSA